MIGEISNRAEPSRKFTQTFVLAQQPNGYYVLNDIFRYLADDDEEIVPTDDTPIVEPEAATKPEQAETVAVDTAEPEEAAPLADSPKAVAAVDAKLEAIAANGEPETVEEPAARAEVNGDANHEKTAVPVTPAVPVVPAEPETVQPEEPETPEHTPAVSTPKEATPAPKEAAPPAKAVPKTWATIASSNRAAAAAAAAAAADAATTPAAAPQVKPATVATSSQQSTKSQQEQPSTAPATEAVATSSQAASTDGAGWQTAGHDHNKKQSRAEEKYPAYIKNVTDKVDASLLRTVLSRFGKLTHFDVNRSRVCIPC